MYQVKYGHGFDLCVIGRGENGLCRVDDKDGNTQFTGTYTECCKWLSDRGIRETMAGKTASDKN